MIITYAEKKSFLGKKNGKKKKKKVAFGLWQIVEHKKYVRWW